MSDMIPCSPSEVTCTSCGALPGEGCKDAKFLGTYNLKPPAGEAPKNINPKDLVGGPKFSLSLLPAAGLVCLEAPFRDGAGKYGPANWRDQPISGRVYLDAAFRHLLLYAAGQDVTDDTGICHVAAAASNLLILLDAREVGSLKDDRTVLPDPGVLADLFEEARVNNS
jgi:hypothetical protein